MTYIYLSPHFDDVALSCGGIIFEQSQRDEAVTILTICAGSPQGDLPPFAQVQHRQWGDPRDPITTRRAEDAEAARRLGANVAYLDVPDCIYRRDAQGRPIIFSNRTLFGRGYVAETTLIQQVARQVRAHVPHKRTTQIIAPLATGRHVDHLVTRDATRLLLAQGYRVQWYEDFPYAEKRGSVARARRAFGASAWQSALSAIDASAKIHAIMAYTSQLKSTFNGARDMAQRVRAYAYAVAGRAGHAERIWTLVA